MKGLLARLLVGGVPLALFTVAFVWQPAIVLVGIAVLLCIFASFLIGEIILDELR